MTERVSVEEIMREIKGEATRVKERNPYVHQKGPIFAVDPQAALMGHPILRVGYTLLTKTSSLPFHSVLVRCATLLYPIIAPFLSAPTYTLADFALSPTEVFFIDAYQKLLGRAPDDEARVSLLPRLLGSKIHPIELLCILQYSAEGRMSRKRVKYVLIAALLQKLYRIPLLGYALKLVIFFMRLPAIGTHLEQQESASKLLQMQIDDLKAKELELKVFQQQLSKKDKLLDEVNTLSCAISKKQNIYTLGTQTHAQELIDFLSKYKEQSETYPILDLGCGEGDWLNLLKQHDIHAYGVDMNTSMIQHCINRGLFVECRNFFDHLSQLNDHSLSAVTGFHIIERLSSEELLVLFQECQRVLRPGGLLILKSLNPENLTIGSIGLFGELSHKRLFTPSLLEFLAEEKGFVKIKTLRFDAVEKSNIQDPEVQARLDGPTSIVLLAYTPEAL